MILRDIREKRGLKLGYVADKLGVSRQTYSKYEQNPDTMSIDQAKRLCEILECEVDEIFFSSKVSTTNIEDEL